MRLRFRKGFNYDDLFWSPPDAAPPAICSYCFGPLPDVPLMMWDKKSACISLCDHCVERHVEAVTV